MATDLRGGLLRMRDEIPRMLSHGSRSIQHGLPADRVAGLRRLIPRDHTIDLLAPGVQAKAMQACQVTCAR